MTLFIECLIGFAIGLVISTVFDGPIGIVVLIAAMLLWAWIAGAL